MNWVNYEINMKFLDLFFPHSELAVVKGHKQSEQITQRLTPVYGFKSYWYPTHYVEIDLYPS